MGERSEYEDLRVDFKAEDRMIIESHHSVVDGIALFMGEHCEVSLNSLEDPANSLVKINNGHHTNRVVGDPLSEHAAEILRNFKANSKQLQCSFTTTSASGGPMRSVFTVITNGEVAIGLLNINFNMNIPLTEFISIFSLFQDCDESGRAKEVENTGNPVEDLVRSAIDDVVKEVSANPQIPNHEKNKYIVFGLQKKGIFDIKGAVMMVATQLKLSKFTVYSYVRELRDTTR